MKTFSTALLSALMLLASFVASADDYLKPIKDFTLVDQTGVTHSLSDYKDKDYIVVYIHGSGCPIARLSVPEYQDIAATYRSKNIEFLMLNSFIQDDMPRILKEAAEFKIDFPILKDEDQTVAKSLGVERTAEVFLIDPRTRETLFRGPINDALGYETQRSKVDNHYLKDALDTILAGGVVDMDDIPDSKGCLVGFFHPAVTGL
ncbi:MAG: redoxin domain-containing protein [Pseudomonadales bacterium]|nr:redoxin domain-containing protein [Pseudomonadales bacterium]MCP5330401.1 redoxin domain-containing protein [Pseudomonadales bacterium]MCP5343986.1 redoxin domain-containing protein [Pseudomonadales bacterium]